MCSMNIAEDTEHFLLICPYLDGARYYALLLWKNQFLNIIYNLFYSALLFWPNSKLTPLILDPMSQFSYSDIAPHQNHQVNMYKLAQDYVFSIHRQRQIFYGELPKTESNFWMKN